MSQLEKLVLDIDELEAMKLCDYENLDQSNAAERMEVSRGTVQRLLYSGRQKLVDALIHSKAIVINSPDSEEY